MKVAIGFPAPEQAWEFDKNAVEFLEINTKKPTLGLCFGALDQDGTAGAQWEGGEGLSSC